jgi:hypothetical protein
MMSKPHVVSEPQSIDPDSDLGRLAHATARYVVEYEIEDLLDQISSGDLTTLEEARAHIAFTGLELLWYLGGSQEVNPIQFALFVLNKRLPRSVLSNLDPSLKLFVPNVDQ